MDFTIKQWVITVLIILIVIVLIDGLRRMRVSKRDSLKMSLKSRERKTAEPPAYGSEFPNGGARLSKTDIDRARIGKAREQYNFGPDMSEKLSEEWVDANENDEEYLASKWDVEAEADDAFEEIDISDDISLEPESELYLDLESEPEPTLQEPELQSSQLEESQLEEPERIPEQASLNLDDPVPVLTESLDGTPSIRSVGKNIKTAIDPVIDDTVSLEELETRSANKPKYESRYYAHKPTNSGKKNADSSLKIQQEVLVINVKASKGTEFSGSDLLHQVLDNGMRYGAMNIFHCHADEDGEGPVLFSMASMLKPGTFDLKTIDHFTTVGVSFFLTLPVADDKNSEAFERMVKVSKHLASALNGELNDEQRSVLTAQTIEHYRERIRDFSRRQKLAQKNKS